MSADSGHYTVLARRFRPQTFADVVGQQHVAQALQNAIRSGRVAHAYLFTGARGVGKTSMARILGKALNCPNAEDAVPCHECEICQAIAAGTDMDVMEIDGASNRGIDDIRTLRSNVNIKSMRSQYKLYIIDEVHMLTKEAFNALLKTLEEPPPNVKFVFCTTEPNKVPETILSRCQRFDLTTIATANIVGRLSQIAEAEQIDIEPAALELVARRAAGSMRDSQSLLDQLFAFGGEKITAADVHRLFGTAADERLVSLVDALIERRRDSLLTELDAALVEGVQLDELINQLIHFVRDLMIIASEANSVTLMGVADESRPNLERQAKAWGLATILAALQILAETKSRMFRASHSRALAELGLVRIAMLSELDDLRAAIEELRSGNSLGPNSSGPGSGRSADPSAGAAQATKRVKTEAASAPSAAQKKTRDDSPAAVEPSSKSEKTPPTIEFRAGNESQLWAQVLNIASDAIRTHVQATSGVAISGPNHLDLMFPASYSFSRQFCERPEVSGRLSEIISQLTGQTPQIVCQISENLPEEEPESPEKIEEKPASNTDVIDDPFVQQAVAVFEATVVKVDGNSTSR
jgi:DNA polymerase-3 subunit gamma/tau